MADSTPSRPSGARRHGLGLGLAAGLAIGAVVGMVLGTLLGAGVAVLVMKARAPSEQAPAEEPADVASPKTLEREGFELRFPGNWRVASEEDDFDPDAYFSIDSPGGSYVTIELIDEPVAVDEEVRQCVADFVPEWISRPEQEPFTQWGAYKGLGLHLSGSTADGEEGGVRIFAHEGDRGAFVAVEIYYAEDRDHVSPGFELIRKSFQLRMPRRPGTGTTAL